MRYQLKKYLYFFLIFLLCITLAKPALARYGAWGYSGQVRTTDTYRYQYGRFTVRMKASPGDETISAFFTYNPSPGAEPYYDWSEIDFEFLGHYMDSICYDAGINHYCHSMDSYNQILKDSVQAAVHWGDDSIGRQYHVMGSEYDGRSDNDTPYDDFVEDFSYSPFDDFVDLRITWTPDEVKWEVKKPSDSTWTLINHLDGTYPWEDVALAELVEPNKYANIYMNMWVYDTNFNQGDPNPNPGKWDGPFEAGNWDGYHSTGIDLDEYPTYAYYDFVKIESYNTETEEFTEVWTDDFNGTSLDSNRWINNPSPNFFKESDVSFQNEFAIVQDGYLMLVMDKKKPNTLIKHQPAIIKVPGPYAPVFSEPSNPHYETLTPGAKTASIPCDIRNLTNDNNVSWSIDDNDLEWVTSITPSSGTLSGRNDRDQITINVDLSNYRGTGTDYYSFYKGMLTLTANGKDIDFYVWVKVEDNNNGRYYSVSRNEKVYSKRNLYYAYDESSSGDTLMMRSDFLLNDPFSGTGDDQIFEYFYANRPIDVKLEAGYNSDFSQITGVTALNTLHVQNGSLHLISGKLRTKKLN